MRFDGVTQSLFAHTGRVLAPGDTLQISRIFHFEFPPSMNGIHNYSMYLLPDNVITDNFVDNNVQNNSGERTVYLTGGALAVNDLDGAYGVLTMAPNPTSGFINVSFNLGGRTDVQISLVDLTGKMIQQISYSDMAAGAHSVMIGNSDIPEGVYLCQVAAGTKIYTGKVVVRH
ncbi:T9SS type A sorting domain-containing protein [archaeon]|nr:MAG: T9SS type A sorting domain-containing protein [archaeon]